MFDYAFAFLYYSVVAVFGFTKKTTKFNQILSFFNFLVLLSLGARIIELNAYELIRLCCRNNFGLQVVFKRSGVFDISGIDVPFTNAVNLNVSVIKYPSRENLNFYTIILQKSILL